MSLTKKLEAMYERGGATAIYKYANKYAKSFLLFWRWCKGCEAETPTIKTTVSCACCGQEKTK